MSIRLCATHSFALPLCFLSGVLLGSACDGSSVQSPTNTHGMTSEKPAFGTPKSTVVEATRFAEPAQIPWTDEAAQRRDPYASYSQQLNFPDFIDGRSPTALERIELDELVLVGVMTQLSAPRALIEDGRGKGYIVKIGTLIGTDSGIVRAVRNQEIVAEERSRTWNHKVVRNLKRISLDKS
ncbi:MAG: pilus assembly protein PilP [Deltaproteobacteria bacterium]|nr:pilus assembly protein PilP [Deltaproteobacteria bacterium]